MEGLDQALHHIVGRLAHDVKNPLAVVLSNLSFLLEEVKDADHLQAVRESLHSAERGTRMIDDAVDLAQIKAGNLRLCTATVQLKDLEEKLHAAVDPQVGRRTLQLVLPLATIKTDQGLLLRALFNLLDHALRQTPSGEIVRLQGGEVEGRLLLEVIDGGAPFDPEVEPSFLATAIPGKQAHQPPWRSDQGLGLLFAGIALRALEGRLELVARPAGTKGVIFRVSLPRELVA